jgi:hypothetical protein
VAASHIAKWDGHAWSALGSGIRGSYYYGPTINALAASGSELYAGGDFTTAGGVAATNIAKWDGSAWSALGSGLNGRVSSLAADGSNLYVGGEFAIAGGVTANSIAKWDGSAWSALGSGMGRSGVTPQVFALALSGTNLYAGGYFDTAGGVTVNGTAKWDGSAWSALGPGRYGAMALAVSGTNLYAAVSSYVSKWDGSAWSGLGSGMSGSVRTLAVSGTALYAGGEFTSAGGVWANYVAKWDGSAWSALGSGMGGDYPVVYALAADGLGHLFVGGTFSLAGTNVSPYIAQANIMPPEGVIRGIGVGSGSVTVDCLGHPVSAYTVQRATDVQFTANLATLFTTNAPWPNGLFQWTDNSPPNPSGFYRLKRE